MKREVVAEAYQLFYAVKNGKAVFFASANSIHLVSSKVKRAKYPKNYAKNTRRRNMLAHTVRAMIPRRFTPGQSSATKKYERKILINRYFPSTTNR